MGYKISLWSSERQDWEKDKGIDAPGIPGEKDHNFTGTCRKGPCTHFGVVSNKPGTRQYHTIFEGKNLTAAAGTIYRAAKKILGTASVGKRMLLCSNGVLPTWQLEHLALPVLSSAALLSLPIAMAILEIYAQFHPL